MCKGECQPLKWKPALELGQEVASILNRAPRAADSSPLSLSGCLGRRMEQMVDEQCWAGWGQDAGAAFGFCLSFHLLPASEVAPVARS